MPIKSEDELKELKSNFNTNGIEFKSKKFEELQNLIKQSLSKNDSDKALFLITKGALSFGSSDIHFDMQEKNVKLRFRIDGLLAEVMMFSFGEYKLLLERLKYKSELKLNITDLPQDGKYRIVDGLKNIDVRISSLPVKSGENVVCRVLDFTQAIIDFASLGFMWTSKRQIEKSISKKNRMIIVTGPTGSGKTTTLYSMLNCLNTADKKIITLEDPVEYEVPGIVQSEVNEKRGYTYTSGLKTLLRQDPDVIMIGEMRDLESANIAAQSAMTGHLVFSTLHTNGATETIERLLNMGLPGYILSSSIDIIIAQRLVRKICPKCNEKYEANETEREIIKWIMKDIGVESVTKNKKNEGFTLCKGTGCEECGHTGYKGRIGIFEVLYFSDKIRALIREGSSPSEILKEARKNDFMLMREDGVLKALKGITALEEVFNVVE
ncbi:MAG: GspE/PulE family protein [Candidatus Gracilibacteria bacterium]|nr:GspE/PulE family protein [Candidatus Gracilibacteria bacterium]